MVELIERARCFCLCATHFHEMGGLALEYRGVVNKHLTAHFFDSTSKMTFLYKIKDGVCRKSFGINVAVIANFPPDVIESAQERLMELELKYKPRRPEVVRQLFKLPTFDQFMSNIHNLTMEA